MASSVDTLAARVCDMTPEQVEDTAMVVTSEMGHVRGLKEIMDAFDKAEVGFLLTTGIRKYHEYQYLKVDCLEKDIVPYGHSERKYRAYHY